MVELSGWRRSTTCDAGACVEVAELGDDVLVRNSTDPEGNVLHISRDRFDLFIADVKADVKVA